MVEKRSADNSNLGNHSTYYLDSIVCFVNGFSNIISKKILSLTSDLKFSSQISQSHMVTTGAKVVFSLSATNASLKRVF